LQNNQEESPKTRWGHFILQKRFLIFPWLQIILRYKPVEALMNEGMGHLIRAHETFEDLIKNSNLLPHK
jgi:hypothetical protein